MRSAKIFRSQIILNDKAENDLKKNKDEKEKGFGVDQSVFSKWI